MGRRGALTISSPRSARPFPTLCLPGAPLATNIAQHPPAPSWHLSGLFRRSCWALSMPAARLFLLTPFPQQLPALANKNLIRFSPASSSLDIQG